ncbi:hypothetical protein FACS189451_01260 [Bacteroidia bacterium]|nr:hypothetical protein FACS189446_7800 [Bacteroidia bacterium]GHT60708.1 hypothetical protein FACS189451_01260 [Bacteroidia bacterium]
MLVKLYRKYISKGIRDKIYKALLGQVLFFLRHLGGNLKSKFIYLFRYILPDTEKNRLYAFMGKYGLMALPYPFILEYNTMHIDCLFDEQFNIYYIMHSGKKLYFPKIYSKEQVIENYRGLITEQDPRSPHQYVTDLNRLKGKTLLDIGAAEAIFSLSVIELVKHVYIFECEEFWLEALTATFAPWEDKVTIVRKYVSDTNDDDTITIDRFLEDKNKDNLFLKMDIEGYEQAALRGGSDTLKEAHDIDFSICTYHKKNDAIEIAKILQSYNLEYERTDGYLYFANEFRRVIIRRKLNNSAS